MTWLLCDYGQVLSMPQPPADRSALAAEAGLGEEAFWLAYWSHRRPYDSADISAVEYWTLVIGARPDADQLRKLIALDNASWLHPDGEALAAVERAARRGYRLAVLSNAPIELADELDRVPWLAAFEPRLFSCRLRRSKPDPAIFQEALARLDSPADQVVFFDDRPDNVAAAAALGICAHHYTTPADLEQLPLPGSPDYAAN